VIVAVVGDTHLPRGSRALPDECVRRLRRADAILHTGDHSSLASLEALRALGPPVHAVHGNVDEPALVELLPAELVADLAGVRIALTHDPGPHAGREARLVARFPRCGAVVYGHTHAPQVELHEGVWILNPGSPTERRRAPTRTMLELRLARGRILPALVELT
jgi:putative phosphoesterase